MESLSGSAALGKEATLVLSRAVISTLGDAAQEEGTKSCHRKKAGEGGRIYLLNSNNCP